MALPFDKPLDNESDKAYAAFCAYRDMPPDERSIEVAYNARKSNERATKGLATSGRWVKWSTDYSWVERAKAYDVHSDRVFLKAREREIIKAQKEVMKHEIATALLMIDRGTTMMKMPIITKADDKGRILKPANASYISQGAKVAMEGVKMLRLAGGMTGSINTLELTGREGLWEDMIAVIKDGNMTVQQAKETIADDSLAEEFMSYAIGKGVLADSQ